MNLDPLYLKSLIGKSVHLNTIDNESHYGTVYTVDPISNAFVLVTSAVGSKHIVAIYPYSSIKDCTEATEGPSPCNIITINAPPYEKCDNRKVKLMDWLRKNQVDLHDDDGILKLKDYSVTIESPYGPEQCYCDNTIVLDRIRTLILKMPL
ncbi:hypothetical protein PPYR_09630 [Photinus pyralis]|uniref:AD domain-containing protein n=1 Tax=Photinus pyralis TaxID=7054 RepID=A0A5N4AMU5_PHOPY|nr:gem-associated protein 6-like [Photinus pyralis]KAB0798637.1 hypothetical protein PPYR_09630 [Photinus pyralis]